MEFEDPRIKKLIEQELAFKAKVLLAADLILTIYGSTQVRYEVDTIHSAKLTNPNDSILKPIFEYLEEHPNPLLDQSITSFQKLRDRERRILEAARERILYRQRVNFFNPIALADWESAINGQPLDRLMTNPRSFFTGATKYNPNTYDRPKEER